MGNNTIPDRHKAAFRQNINAINVFRIKIFCLGFICLGFVLFLIDYQMLNTQGVSDFHPYYLWSDAILFGIGLIFYLLFTGLQKYHETSDRFQQVAIFTASFVILSWCGAVSAVEYFTNSSVSTLIIGVLVLATGISLGGWAVFLIYGAGLASFILCKNILNTVPLNFFTEHLNMIGLVLFGWLLSRILYINKSENFMNRITILEKNELLATEILTRKEAQKKLEQSQKILEQRVFERTRELLDANEALRNEIHEREKMETSLQQAQKMESIGTLAGGIAHDFNNILFPIIGHSEILLEDIPENSEFRASLEEIYAGSLRARDLVKQILTFSRQENSPLKLMKVQPVIKEALKLIRATIPTTIEIKQDIDEECGVIKADPTQIHQVIMNLATNAYHAMEKRGGLLTVSLKEYGVEEPGPEHPDLPPGRYVCLSIADTGTGMDKALIKKIFDPFFTTKETGKGTGMGLSVVHGIVTGMGGVIHVDSHPGKGTGFKIFLPAVSNLAEKQVKQVNETIQGGTERILLVDDEGLVEGIEKRMLERLGYKVTSYTSSMEALEAFRSNPEKFDLIITDMAMPGIAGDRLSSEILKIRSDIPILLCTGFSDTISEEKARMLGIGGYLFKPLMVKDLACMVRKMIDTSKIDA